MTIGCGGIGGLAGAALAAPAATRWGARRTLIGALLVGGAVQVLIPLAPAVAGDRHDDADRDPGDRRRRADRLSHQRNDAAATAVAARGARPGGGHVAGRHRPPDACRRAHRRRARARASACGRRCGCSRSASRSPPRGSLSPAARFREKRRSRFEAEISRSLESDCGATNYRLLRSRRRFVDSSRQAQWP